MRTIPRTIYRIHGEFVACVSDSHPELAEDALGPEQQRKTLAIQRPPRWSERNIRRALGRDREQKARLVNRRRIERERA